MIHTPVMLRESIEGLNIDPSGIYIDGTLGRGGHTRAMTEIMRGGKASAMAEEMRGGKADEMAEGSRGGRIIAIDRDADAIKEARALLSEYAGIISFVHANFADLKQILDTEGVGKVDGMLFDLGVSSPHLDDVERGFSYMHDAPLDMRMDKNQEQTAHTVVNTWPQDRLRNILYEYGEEKFAGRIAAAIIRKREIASIASTFELVEIIKSAMPAAARREAQHPAKRSFQAIRIAVNDELGALSRVLEIAPEMLKTGGRICVISFHSLEDRLVKNSFAQHARGCTCPKDFPVCVCGVVPTLKVITKKPIVPGDDEAGSNSRARSAKLRIAEKV